MKTFSPYAIPIVILIYIFLPLYTKCISNSYDSIINNRLYECNTNKKSDAVQASFNNISFTSFCADIVF